MEDNRLRCYQEIAYGGSQIDWSKLGRLQQNILPDWQLGHSEIQWKSFEVSLGRANIKLMYLYWSYLLALQHLTDNISPYKDWEIVYSGICAHSDFHDHQA